MACDHCAPEREVPNTAVACTGCGKDAATIWRPRGAAGAVAGGAAATGAVAGGGAAVATGAGVQVLVVAGAVVEVAVAAGAAAEVIAAGRVVLGGAGAAEVEAGAVAVEAGAVTVAVETGAGAVTSGRWAGIVGVIGQGTSSPCRRVCRAGLRAAALAGQVPPMPLRMCRPTWTVLSCAAL